MKSGWQVDCDNFICLIDCVDVFPIDWGVGTPRGVFWLGPTRLNWIPPFPFD